MKKLRNSLAILPINLSLCLLLTSSTIFCMKKYVTPNFPEQVEVKCSNIDTLKALVQKKYLSLLEQQEPNAELENLFNIITNLLNNPSLDAGERKALTALHTNLVVMSSIISYSKAIKTEYANILNANLAITGEPVSQETINTWREALEQYKNPDLTNKNKREINTLLNALNVIEQRLYPKDPQNQTLQKTKRKLNF